LASSSGSPQRPNGTADETKSASLADCSSVTLARGPRFQMGVFVAPGATTFTRMLRGARSAAMAPLPSMQKSTALSGAANRSTNLWARSQGTPLPPRKPHPTRPRPPSRSLLPSQPQHRRTTRRFPTSTGTNPALPIPSSTPEDRIGFPTRPAASSMPFWTKAAPSGCPFPQKEASLGGVAEVDKRPNFIELYEISRSLHSDKCIFGKGVTRTFRLRRRRPSPGSTSAKGNCTGVCVGSIPARASTLQAIANKRSALHLVIQ
jgi:hypothetical protein